MASRMEKYHSNTSTSNKRSVRNESLYRDIYENARYSNIENVATLEKTNEISLEQIQELLREREQIKKRNSTVKNEIPKFYCEPEPEEKNYDICDVLVKAKDEHIDDNKNRSLKNTQYNILKNININDNISFDKEEVEKTLVNTTILKEFDDNELCLDMLSDLKASEDTIVHEGKSADELLKEVQEEKDNYIVQSDDSVDHSFYTSSMSFKDDDFEQLKDLQDSIENNNKLIKVLFFLLFIVILCVISFVIFKMI